MTGIKAVYDAKRYFSHRARRMDAMPGRLKHKVALVTAAGQGIGRAISLAREQLSNAGRDETLAPGN